MGLTTGLTPSNVFISDVRVARPRSNSCCFGVGRRKISWGHPRNLAASTRQRCLESIINWRMSDGNPLFESGTTCSIIVLCFSRSIFIGGCIPILPLDLLRPLSGCGPRRPRRRGDREHRSAPFDWCLQTQGDW